MNVDVCDCALHTNHQRCQSNACLCSLCYLSLSFFSFFGFSLFCWFSSLFSFLLSSSFSHLPFTSTLLTALGALMTVLLLFNVPLHLFLHIYSSAFFISYFSCPLFSSLIFKFVYIYIYILMYLSIYLLIYQFTYLFSLRPPAFIHFFMSFILAPGKPSSAESSSQPRLQHLPFGGSPCRPPADHTGQGISLSTPPWGTPKDTQLPFG